MPKSRIDIRYRTFAIPMSMSAWQRAKEAAERCKIELDKAESTTVDIPFLADGKTLKVTLEGARGCDNEKLEQRAAHHFSTDHSDAG